jgi:hypothetical protein
MELASDSLMLLPLLSTGDTESAMAGIIATSKNRPAARAMIRWLRGRPEASFPGAGIFAFSRDKAPLRWHVRCSKQQRFFTAQRGR